MDRFFVCDEFELKAAANQCSNYADFLARTVASYRNVLKKVVEEGLKDQQVGARISALALKLPTYIFILNQIDYAIQRITKAEIEELEALDQFKFPRTDPLELLRILAAFL